MPQKYPVTTFWNQCECVSYVSVRVGLEVGVNRVFHVQIDERNGILEIGSDTSHDLSVTVSHDFQSNVGHWHTHIAAINHTLDICCA